MYFFTSLRQGKRPRIWTIFKLHITKSPGSSREIAFSRYEIEFRRFTHYIFLSVNRNINHKVLHGSVILLWNTLCSNVILLEKKTLCWILNRINDFEKYGSLGVICVCDMPAVPEKIWLTRWFCQKYGSERAIFVNSLVAEPGKNLRQTINDWFMSSYLSTLSNPKRIWTVRVEHFHRLSKLRAGWSKHNHWLAWSRPMMYEVWYHHMNIQYKRLLICVTPYKFHFRQDIWNN